MTENNNKQQTDKQQAEDIWLKARDEPRQRIAGDRGLQGSPHNLAQSCWAQRWRASRMKYRTPAALSFPRCPASWMLLLASSKIWRKRTITGKGASSRD